jgi:crotonobetainyl-CoA:carnitine CoA-transferase CaiB-like acyl-CoA transferase
MIRVLDLTRGPAGAFATLLLAELGLEVVKVEPPGAGDPLRRSEDGDELAFAFLNRRKKSITLDLPAGPHRVLLLRLARTAGLIVEDAPPGRMAVIGLSWPALQAENGSLVYVSISPFGQDGPHASWKASEFVLQAMGGVVSSTGWDEGAPQRLPGFQASYAAGIQAAGAALAAFYGVQSGMTGGVHLDISIQEAMATYATRDISRYAYTGQDVQRFGREFGMQGWPPIAVARDGYVMLEALRAEWEAFALFLGLDDRFLTHEWHEPAVRAARWSEILPDFERAVRARTKREWFEASAAQGYTFAPIDDLGEVLDSPQLAARGFFSRLEDRDLPSPRLPFTHTMEPVLPNRASRLGEHNRAILGDELGLSESDLRALEVQGAAGEAERSSP